ncbi:hypothetical protein A54_257 [Septuagintavirus sv54]|uniref:Uncharacterized protein n=1 Tax=Escherichia phage A5-4 TaxID=2996162 RepID=A0AAE9PW92_9CAUD|nr:hypothetical protein A54_257 [Escherichia phage A5-4]
MIKKFVAWVKSLFIPLEVETAAIDKYIAKQAEQRQETASVKFSPVETRSLEEPLKENEVLVGLNIKDKTMKVVDISVERPKSQATPPKPLDEQLKGVELPSYAQGKKLPPKAKRQYIDQARRAAPRKMSDSPNGYGTSQVDPQVAALGGVATYAAVMSSSEDRTSSSSSYCSSSRSSSYESSSSYDSYSSDSSSSSSSSSCD